MRLKNLLLIAVMLFTAVGASAQFHASVRAGATATTLGEQKLKMGIRAGVGVEYLFSERWGIRSGLFYTMKGATTATDVFCYDPLKTTKLSYLDIPFEAQVSFGLSQKSVWRYMPVRISPACFTPPFPKVPAIRFIEWMSALMWDLILQ